MFDADLTVASYIRKKHAGVIIVQSPTTFEAASISCKTFIGYKENAKQKLLSSVWFTIYGNVFMKGNVVYNQQQQQQQQHSLFS